MRGNEIRELRRNGGMSQAELGRDLGLTPTFVGMMERGVKAVESRTDLAVRYLLDQYCVDRAKDGRYFVARRTMREKPSAQALACFHSETMLYGLFNRRDHAYRWVAALRSSKLPARATRSVLRERVSRVESAQAGSDER